jgi:hypothetical protein
VVYQIVYMSSAPEVLSTDQLSDVLDKARKRNARNGITGLLIYHDQMFFQVLEGERESVINRFSQICNDPRSNGVSLMWNGEAESRTFPHWDMAYIRPEDLDQKGKDSVIKLATVATERSRELASGSIPAELVKWMLHEFPVKRIRSGERRDSQENGEKNQDN